METMVGVAGNDEGKFGETGVEKFRSTTTSPKQISDSVVYKLVRVEGDGRLVPATDEEVMEVVDLLENDKSTVHIADSGQTVGCISNGGSSVGKSQLEISDGLSQRANTEVDQGRFNARLEENLPSLSPNVNDKLIYQSGSLGECSSPPREPVEYESSPSSVCPSQKPDFSKLEGEICLDNLTIRELHDTFKATFGRETTVKDKMWLKRRIAMGLTNSCEVSTMTFIYKDNKVVMKGEEESCKNMDHKCIMVPEYGARDDCCKVSSVGHISQMEDDQTVSAKRLSYNEYACGGEDVQKEPLTTKRVRKPTRRYIEELSESDSVEHGGRLLAASRCSIQGQISPRSAVRLVKNVSSDGRAIITRLDSLGGSGVQIPYVSRIRRSRPRKNIMALMRFHPSGSDMDDELLKKATSMSSSQSANELENENRVVKAGYASVPIKQPIITEPENNPRSVVSNIEIEQNMEPKPLDSSGETSDDNLATVPTSKGGMRRKHHRAWTLSEVMKLVEGVSRYGAGKWSEIKRLSFASYSHRTSVDLKDKWRNLLRASFAQTPPDKGINSRKHASIPIPAPILLRVRELAEMHAQGLPNLGPNKIGGSGGRSLHDPKSGFL